VQISDLPCSFCIEKNDWTRRSKSETATVEMQMLVWAAPRRRGEVALYHAASIGRATEPRLPRRARVSALMGNDRFRKKARS
jgi:hypothetical protein